MLFTHSKPMFECSHCILLKWGNHFQILLKWGNHSFPSLYISTESTIISIEYLDLVCVCVCVFTCVCMRVMRTCMRVCVRVMCTCMRVCVHALRCG